MDNAAIAERCRRQAEARLEMAGFLISSDPAIQSHDRGNRRVTRSNLVTLGRTACGIGPPARRRPGDRHGHQRPISTPNFHIVR